MYFFLLLGFGFVRQSTTTTGKTAAAEPSPINIKHQHH
jgi:hypothetical protein